MPTPTIQGFPNVLRELSSLCAELDASIRSEWILKRLQFFAFDLQSIVQHEQAPREKLATLNRYFFEHQRFQAVAENVCLVERVTLQTVLSKRVGTPLAVGLLYAYLANQCGVKLEFANIQPIGFLKFIENGVWRFIDVAQSGRILESDGLLESIQARVRSRANALEADRLLEVVPHDRLVVEYLNGLKNAFRTREAAEPLLTIQNWLLTFQPNNVAALGERALLQRRLGHFKSALSDLKRYFAFVQRERAPAELARAYDELLAMFGRARPIESNVEH